MKSFNGSMRAKHLQSTAPSLAHRKAKQQGLVSLSLPERGRLPQLGMIRTMLPVAKWANSCSFDNMIHVRCGACQPFFERGMEHANNASIINLRSTAQA